MHSEKSSTSQTGFYSIQMCFQSLIDETAIHKDFALKIFHKKTFPSQFDNIKRKFLSSLNFYFFPCNAKQEINLTLPETSYTIPYPNQNSKDFYLT